MFFKNLFAKEKGGNKALDVILESIRVNAANNYKDEAIAGLKKLEDEVAALKAAGSLNEKQIAYYGEKIDLFREEFKKYSHKDQKVRW